MSLAEMFVAEPPVDGPADRLPPQDIAAEQSVLGAMLLSKDAIADVVEVLRGQDFYRPAHEAVFEAVLDLYGKGEPADAVTVSAELTRRGEIGRVGGAAYIHTLISMVPTAANAGYYAGIVRERAILRRLVEAGTRIVQMGYSAEGGNADEIVDRAQAEVYAVTDKRASEDYQPLSAIMEGALDEIEAIGSRGGQLVGVPTGFADLDELTNGLHGGQMVIVAARPAVGKALALDTPLPTPAGWTTIGEVQVGDHVMGADGTPTRVVAATEVMTGRPCYEVEFSDGAKIVADADHLWLTDTRASRKSAQAAAVGYNRYRNQRTFAAVRTTKEIAETLYCNTADKRYNHTVRVAAPLQFPPADLPIDPYLLGVWLGDGTSAVAQITSADPEIPAEIEARGYKVIPSASAKYRYCVTLPDLDPLPEVSCSGCGKTFVPRCVGLFACSQECAGRTSKPKGQKGAGYTCRLCGGRSTGELCAACHSKRSVQAQLRDLGVLRRKHIPVAYLRASEAQRRDLLAGLLDTDGTVNSNGTVSLDLTDERLAHEALELVLSLGCRASVTTRRVAGRTEEFSTCWRIHFSPNSQVFRLPRKQERLRMRGEARRNARNIVAATPVESVPVRCIQVEAPDSLYLAGRSMIPTHNSTLALDFARAAAIKNQLATVFFSLEMGRNEITMRLLSAESRVPLHHMRTGAMTDDDWNRLARRMGEVSEAPLFIDDSPNMTMMEIRAKCRRLKQRHDLKLVVVDYLQLMQSGRRVESRQQEVSEFSRSMKLLAKELDVPVVALSQLNRGPEQRTDKKPMMSDLRESGSLEQDADLVMLLHREDLYEKESPRAGEADIIVAKHRNGPTATITVAFQGHYSRFVDMQA